jgi:hypothetical protein
MSAAVFRTSLRKGKLDCGHASRAERSLEMILWTPYFYLELSTVRMMLNNNSTYYKVGNLDSNPGPSGSKSLLPPRPRLSPPLGGCHHYLRYSKETGISSRESWSCTSSVLTNLLLWKNRLTKNFKSHLLLR